jgi:hypothetical protein
MDREKEMQAVGKLQTFEERYRELGKDSSRKHFSGVFPAGFGGGKTGSGTELRKEEWEELSQLLKETKEFFVFEPFSMWCTDLSMRVYRHPLVKGNKPTLLLVVGGDCMGEVGLDRKWTEFTPYTHNKENVEYLELYGLEKAESYGYYDY